MRKFLLIFALCSAFANAATLAPVTLLNPSGSVAGQAIVSTGPTTAPAWAAVPLTGVTGTLAIANGGTGATSAATARTNLGLGTSATVNTGTSGATIPLLSTANTWTLGQAFTVRPTFSGATPWDSANLASPAQTTGATFTGAITPSQTLGIVGTTTNNNANAGSFGEYQSNSTAGTSLTSATAANATSIANLPAGDWDVSCVVTFVPAAGTTPSIIVAAINTASATVPGPNIGGFVQFASVFPAGAAQVMIAPTVRVSLASATTTFCVAQSTFTGGTSTVNGFIRARRVR